MQFGMKLYIHYSCHYKNLSNQKLINLQNWVPLFRNHLALKKIEETLTTPKPITFNLYFFLSPLCFSLAVVLAKVYKIDGCLAETSLIKNKLYKPNWPKLLRGVSLNVTYFLIKRVKVKKKHFSKAHWKHTGFLLQGTMVQIPVGEKILSSFIFE